MVTLLLMNPPQAQYWWDMLIFGTNLLVLAAVVLSMVGNTANPAPAGAFQDGLQVHAAEAEGQAACRHEGHAKVVVEVSSQEVVHHELSSKI